MEPINPYQAPTATLQSTNSSALPTGIGCPRCQSTDVEKPSWTWWGGAVGPRMFNHTICRQCRFGFNSVTRRSNTGPIWIYRGVTWSCAIAFIVWRVWLRT